MNLRRRSLIKGRIVNGGLHVLLLLFESGDPIRQLGVFAFFFEAALGLWS